MPWSPVNLSPLHTKLLDRIDRRADREPLKQLFHSHHTSVMDVLVYWDVVKWDFTCIK